MDWKTRDVVAAICACGAAFALLALAVGAALEIASPTGHLSEQASTVIATALGALIGALATYLGGNSE